MSKALSALIASAVIAAVASPAAAAAPRLPTARWVVNYDDAQCVASRSYGTVDKPLFLALKPSPTGSVMRVMLMRKGNAMEAEQRTASVRFGDGPPVAAKALEFGDRTTKSFVTSINLPMATFTANRAAKSIEIRSGPVNELLSVPGLSDVQAAFDDCLANLREVWNVGAPHSARVARPAVPNKPLRALFSASDYPMQAVRQGDTGLVGLWLLIDEAGKVRDCTVEETSGYATLDTMSCFVITSQAKFQPAAGADGKPVRSAQYQRINWKIRP